MFLSTIEKLLSLFQLNRRQQQQYLSVPNVLFSIVPQASLAFALDILDALYSFCHIH